MGFIIPASLVETKAARPPGLPGWGVPFKLGLMDETSWWIYDENDATRPGWRLWRVDGLLTQPPSPHCDARFEYALGSCEEGAWRIWMCQPGLGAASPILHEVERGGAGANGERARSRGGELALLAPPAGTPREWVVGSTALSKDIESLLGREAENDRKDELRGHRSLRAPKLWDGARRPDPGWEASMARWRQEFDQWSQGAAGGHGSPGWPALRISGAWLGLCRARGVFLQNMALGADSPAQGWADACRDMPEGEAVGKCAELGRAMERVEMELGAFAGLGGVKACRI